MFLKRIPRSRIAVKAEDLCDILSLTLKGQLIDGPFIKQFEEEFAKYIGVRFALSAASGRLALGLILRALELKREDEIILPAHTFYAVRETIEKGGFKPVFVDINENDNNIDTRLIERKIGAKTRAILATHLYGTPCELNKILDIAKRHGLFVIEDCAQAIGARYRDKKTGSYGDCSFFSFESVKPFHTFGGGMITTDSPVLYENLKNQIDKLPFPAYRNIAKRIIFTIVEAVLTHPLIFSLAVYPVLLCGAFFNKDFKTLAKKTKSKFKIHETKYSNFQACLGLKKLQHLDALLDRRIANAEFLISGIKPNVYSQSLPLYLKPVYYYLVLKDNDARHSAKKLLRKGIDSNSSLAEKCCGSFAETEYPITRKVGDSALLIPVYPELTKAEMKYICDTINQLSGK